MLANLELDDFATANDVLSLLTLLAKPSSENASVLHSIEAHTHILPRISVVGSRLAALELLQHLLLNDVAHTEDYMGMLIKELLASAHIEDITQLRAQQSDILTTLWGVLRARPPIRAAFRELGGFLCVLLPAGLLKEAFAESECHDESARLLLLSICTLGAALEADPQNAAFFQESGAAGDLCSSLIKSKVYQSTHARPVLKGLLELATDTTPLHSACEVMQDLYSLQ